MFHYKDGQREEGSLVNKSRAYGEEDVGDSFFKNAFKQKVLEGPHTPRESRGVLAILALIVARELSKETLIII